MNDLGIKQATITIWVFLAIVVTGGCANSPYNMQNLLPSSKSGNSHLDPRLAKSDEANYFSKSGLEACIGGAFIGLAGCAISNASDKEACMIKAAILGCGIGFGANGYLDQRRSEYSNKQQRLDAMLSDIEKDNKRLQSLNQTASSVLADDRKALRKIKSEIAQKKLNSVAAKKRLQEIDANTRFLKETLADLRQRQQKWREVAQEEKANGANVAKLDAQINSMQNRINSLQTEIDSLFQQRTAIQLG